MFWTWATNRDPTRVTYIKEGLNFELNMHHPSKFQINDVNEWMLQIRKTTKLQKIKIELKNTKQKSKKRKNTRKT